MKLIRIVENGPDFTPVRLHAVLVPQFKDPGFYRSTLSYDAWSNHWANKVYDANTKRHKLSRTFHTMTHERDWEFHLRSYDRAFGEAENPLRLIPYQEHGSIWDFYIAISWDYRRKKFMNPIRKQLLEGALERLTNGQYYICDCINTTARDLGHKLVLQTHHGALGTVVEDERVRLLNHIDHLLEGKFSLGSWLIGNGHVEPCDRGELDRSPALRETRIAWVKHMLANW